MVGSVAALIIAIGFAIWVLAGRKANALNATDTVVLADFVNNTGDSVFDDTLKEALSAQLTQSPFLSILSEQRVAAILKLMGRPKGTPLGKDTAREVCLRAGSRAYIIGSIARLGGQYSIVLQAVECQNGYLIARTQAIAESKERVLHALDDAGKELRGKVGESLGSVEKFATPLEQVTTPSLEALRAYTMARKALRAGDYVGCVPLAQWAVRQDPNFAMAHLTVGLCQGNLGGTALGAESYRKAFDLRERLSNWEKFAIESRYYLDIIGDLEQARRSYATWAKTYPREPIAIDNLGSIDATLGHHERAVEAHRESVRLSQGNANFYANLCTSYFALDRLEDVKLVLDEAMAKLDSGVIHLEKYWLAFLQNDAGEMARQVAWSAGKPGVEDDFLAVEALTAAYAGRIASAREFVRRTVTLALQADKKEAAANSQVVAALWEAHCGYRLEARQRAAAALKLSRSKDIEYAAALSLAMAGDPTGAQALADALNQRHPSDTIVQLTYLPVIRAQLAIGRRESTRAVEALQSAAPYELGLDVSAAIFVPFLNAAFVRGEAYLNGGLHQEAVAEFQKVLSHRGIVINYPVGAVTRLQLARAYARQNNIVKAKAAYEDFLNLWKQADPGVPILREAQSEYKKLK
jgi:tetratricopeptide (TPR) repeat protein